MSVAVRGCLKRSHPDARRSEAGGVQRRHEPAENSAGFPAFLAPAAGPNTATHSGTPDLRVVEAVGRPREAIATWSRTGTCQGYEAHASLLRKDCASPGVGCG